MSPSCSIVWRRWKDNRRDPEAEALIAEGLRSAPHAPYALVQTVLVQDEALRNADARIRELEGGRLRRAGQGGFLDNMRDTFLGRRAEGRGSVPSVGTGRDAPWQSRAPEAAGRRAVIAAARFSGPRPHPPRA